MELEVRLTGILNTYTAAIGEEVSSFGTLVAPQVQAHHHQHLFSLRIDPMIEYVSLLSSTVVSLTSRLDRSGVQNTVVESEVRALDAPTGSDENWAGNGFYSTKQELKSTSEGARQADPLKGRQWSMVNPSKKHYSSGANVGYKVRLSLTCPFHEFG